jgi:hypothetical protein
MIRHHSFCAHRRKNFNSQPRVEIMTTSTNDATQPPLPWGAPLSQTDRFPKAPCLREATALDRRYRVLSSRATNATQTTTDHAQGHAGRHHD